tara:strand:+ start:772 stop:1470 length:699 start_codon:yes stop_codon:yes gene_type:complete
VGDGDRRSVNFLGHVFVASWRRGTEPSVAPYAFGSMIPDFVGMARARVEAVDHRETADGVALHHATDDVFHGSSVFLGLLEELQRFQADRGVRRGTAMAVAHVGSELVLDGWLLDRDAEQGGAVGALYLDALAAGLPLVGHLRFRQGAEGADRMRALLERLGAYGLEGHRSVDVIADRLDRALASRPRLRILDEDREAVRVSLVHCEKLVHERAPEWVAGLREALANQAQGE